VVEMFAIVFFYPWAVRLVQCLFSVDAPPRKKKLNQQLQPDNPVFW
jgi:hypothetical protein